MQKTRWNYSGAALLGAITAILYLTYVSLTARDMPNINACAVGIVTQVLFFLLLAWVHNLRLSRVT